MAVERLDGIHRMVVWKLCFLLTSLDQLFHKSIRRLME
uniref:Uncharacterized protein n=1 Tax=virus sp. ctBM815 TaxID=2825806 RepID=A0A8S5RJK8_9VIRU|nr:MAG TPA: hypothetical protein [virus sp. ctBM815]DAG45339.1 MAG TPA: hypothetical protein [Caudoviricetes sp.]